MPMLGGEGMNWQPIETAPKDGTRILGYQPAAPASVEDINIVAWDSGRWHDDEWYCYTITHWMPLPAPPEIEA